MSLLEPLSKTATFDCLLCGYNFRALDLDVNDIVTCPACGDSRVRQALPKEVNDDG